MRKVVPGRTFDLLDAPSGYVWPMPPSSAVRPARATRRATRPVTSDAGRRRRNDVDDHDEALDALTRQLVDAGLLELFTEDDGDEAMRLTLEDEKVARRLVRNLSSTGCAPDLSVRRDCSLRVAVDGDQSYVARLRVGRAESKAHTLGWTIIRHSRA